MRRLYPRLTYANVVSTVALVVALTGASAYAANQLADRSVGAPQLRPGAVTAGKIRKNAVTAPKIKVLAVKEGKLANGAVSAIKLGAAAVSSRSLAAGAVSNEKLANDSVTGEKVVEETLNQVPSAVKSDFASAAESANPVAFAAVDAEGNVNASLSKGLGAGNVTRLTSGIYCILAPGFNPRGAQVTPRNVGDGDVNSYATVGGTEICPAPGVEIRTYKGALMSAPFYVSLYR
jgi:hypothetical protein